MSFTDPNARIFYACQAVLVVERNTAEVTAPNHADSKWLSGVQSIGVSRVAPSQSLPDIGRFQQQFKYYGQQEIEITIERVIDQDADLFYHVTPSNYTDVKAYQKSHLLYEDNLNVSGFVDTDNPTATKSLKNYDISLIYGSDKFSRVGGDRHNSSGGGDADRNALLLNVYRNCLLINVSYNISIDGSVTETSTLITRYSEKITSIGGSPVTLQSFSDAQLPAADRSGGLPSAESGNTVKWHDFKFREPGLSRYSGSDLTRQNSDSTYISILPDEVELMFDLSNELDGIKITGLQRIQINLGMNYTELTDVGRWPGSHTAGTGFKGQKIQNLWRVVDLPVDVAVTFEGIARQDFPQQINNDGTFFTAAANFNTALGKPAPTTNAGGDVTEWNKTDRPILITALKQNGSYFIWDLGEHNYVTVINTDGGGTDGNNLTTSISYENNFSEAVFVKHTSVQDLTYDGPY